MTGAVAAVPEEARLVLEAFELRTGLAGLSTEIKRRGDGDYLLVKVGHPSERLFQALRDVTTLISKRNPFRNRVTLVKETRTGWLDSPEAVLFQRLLSEGLTVGRESLGGEFFERYIPSVLGAETQVASTVNHIVFGRRGSGKSSLLVYAAKKLVAKKHPYAWISLQTYEKRNDEKVSVDVIRDLLDQFDGAIASRTDSKSLRAELDTLDRQQEVSADDVRRLLPKVKRVLVPAALAGQGLTIFLDDLHLLAREFQAQFLSHLYSFSRGNRISLKISSIEGLTQNWDPSNRIGLEVPNDAQAIRLDYNLTMPDKAKQHIRDILDVNAKYCGLPSVGALCGAGVLDRVVWVSAGVPRDAIYILLQAMSKAAFRKRRVVAVADINSATSEAADDKLRALQKDAGGESSSVLSVLEEVKSFCQNERKNAFLVEIRNGETKYDAILKLIDLRLLHVLSPGITPDRAGKRYMALLLDYGFYVGIRTARSIELFQKQPKTLTSKELRNLPRLELADD